MTPRLAVTREQVDRWDELYDGAPADRPPRELRLRLPERLTMPCHRLLHLTSATTTAERYTSCRSCDGRGRIPIPEGTRVEVGWWELSPSANPNDWPTDPWRPVAFATLTEAAPTGTGLGLNNQWSVTLSDIKPVEADQ